MSAARRWGGHAKWVLQIPLASIGKPRHFFMQNVTKQAKTVFQQGRPCNSTTTMSDNVRTVALSFVLPTALNSPYMLP